MQLSNTCFSNVLELVNWCNTFAILNFLSTDSIQQSGDSQPLNTSPISSDNSAALACHINITRSTDSEAVGPPIIGFTVAIYHNYDAKVGEPLKGPHERYIQEGTFLLHQNQFSKEVADRLSAELAPRLFAEQDCGESRHQPLQPPRLQRKGRGVHFILRSGVDQRTFAHTVSPFQALPSPLSGTSRQRARYEHTHCDGLRRLTRTAVAPWSCKVEFHFISFKTKGTATPPTGG